MVPNPATQQDPPYGVTRKRTNPTLQLIDWLFSPPSDAIPIPPFVGGVDSAGYRNFVIRSRIPVPHQTDAEWGDLKRLLQPDDFRTEYAYPLSLIMGAFELTEPPVRLANDLVEVYFQIC